MGEAYIDRSVDTIGVVPVVWVVDAATWQEAGEMGSNREATRGAAPALRRTRGPALIDGEAAFPLNRDRVVRMSAQLFARNGYHATGIAEICAATGLSRGTLYYYVEGKETLLYEICRTQVLRMNERARAILAEPMEPDARLRALAGSLLANIAEHREEWAVFFREFGSLGPERRAVIKQARDEYERYWLQAVLEQSGTRDARIPPKIIVKGLLGMFNYTYLWFSRDGSLGTEDLAEAFTSLVLDGLHRQNASTIPPNAREDR